MRFDSKRTTSAIESMDQLVWCLCQKFPLLWNHVELATFTLSPISEFPTKYWLNLVIKQFSHWTLKEFHFLSKNSTFSTTKDNWGHSIQVLLPISPFFTQLSVGSFSTQLDQNIYIYIYIQLSKNRSDNVI